jgi:hypothetical protein
MSNLLCHAVRLKIKIIQHQTANWQNCRALRPKHILPKKHLRKFRSGLQCGRIYIGMNDIVSKLKTPEECAIFAKNTFPARIAARTRSSIWKKTSPPLLLRGDAVNRE